ncbi:MAG TPA: 30S ribosome-binding factor RbfA [candidate division Zixibacteria bacterium]|nr:30S ribosome-binding factor RbfA [candidate division Zixibacteria bacterium]
MEFSRVDRLQSQIIKEISDIVANELRDTPPAMITFTRAEISRDLKYAKVYFSVLGKDDDMTPSFEFLKRHAGVIRHMVGKRMRIRFTPEITFHFDTSTAHVMRINEILEQIKRDEKKP